jgi:hypothetical protein
MSTCERAVGGYRQTRAARYRWDVVLSRRGGRQGGRQGGGKLAHPGQKGVVVQPQPGGGGEVEPRVGQPRALSRLGRHCCSSHHGRRRGHLSVRRLLSGLHVACSSRHGRGEGDTVRVQLALARAGPSKVLSELECTAVRIRLACRLALWQRACQPPSERRPASRSSVEELLGPANLLLIGRKKENTGPRGMGGRHAATTQGF